jgi:hypothetical protein
MSQALLDATTRFDEYQRLVQRLQAAVEAAVPVGSTVLVVSKGDPALLALGQRTGWHFPRAVDGQYAGHHPSDSNDAISRLDFQRGLGARYLVIPSTSGWWFEHYPDFIAHVRSCARPLVEDSAVGWIFELTPRPAAPPVAQAAPGGPSLAAQQLLGLLEAVLPAAATVAFIGPGEGEAVRHAPMPAFVLRDTDDPAIDEAAAIAELRQIASGAAEFLVVPTSSHDWLAGQERLAAHIAQSYALVTDQRNVCRIYDLRLRPGEQG